VTYETYEESAYAGSPVELYKFDRNDVSFWTYTSADTTQYYEGRTYTAIPIQRSKIEQTQDLEQASVTIRMPTSTDFLDQYAGGAPADIINLTIYRFHYGDTDYSVAWIGRVMNVGFSGFEAEVYCESILTSLQRPMNRRRYQISCPHVLYGTACGVTKASYEVEAELTVISGTTLYSPTFWTYDDNYFTGGTVSYTSGGITVPRAILEHNDNFIVVNLTLTGAEVGSTVKAYPGCKHNIYDCNTKFSNILNYGGQPFIPDENPFDTMVF
jgi:uncharacterized phage protein (TIGR02218 family)